MSSDERKLHFAEQLLELEESELKGLLQAFRGYQTEQYYDVKAKAEDCLGWYKEDGDEDHLRDGEFYAEMARSIKIEKPTVKEIREQRRRVQCQKTKTIKLRKQLGKRND